MVSHTKNSKKNRAAQQFSRFKQSNTKKKTSTYTKHADIKRITQKQCEYRFTLAHRAPITKHTLGVKLGYLTDEEVARLIIEETYGISTDLDNITKLILEEIRKIGTKTRNKEGQERGITPEYFITSWQVH